MNKETIISEIQRTATGGKALGVARFAAVTGIKKHDWLGKYWARWGDALVEAGYSPNEWTSALEESQILWDLVQLTRRLKKFPTNAEMGLERRDNPTFPDPRYLKRFGSRTELLERLLKFCASRAECADVEKIVGATPIKQAPNAAVEVGESRASGYVYLVSGQQAYKIGCTRAPYRRVAEIANQSASGATLEHLISTDDPEGIEDYWHRRFADKRILGENKQSGEWFRLTKADVNAFKRRKNFM